MVDKCDQGTDAQREKFSQGSARCKPYRLPITNDNIKLQMRLEK